MGTRPAGSWGKSPFGRMGRLRYRTCVRAQGAVPPVVPVPAVPSTPAAWTRCWTGCSRRRWPAYRTPPWPVTWLGCGSRSPDWSRSSPAGWWSSTAAGRPGSPGRCPPRPGCARPAGHRRRPGRRGPLLRPRPGAGRGRPGAAGGPAGRAGAGAGGSRPARRPGPAAGGAGRPAGARRPGRGRGGRGGGAGPAPADGGRHVRRRGGARRRARPRGRGHRAGRAGPLAAPGGADDDRTPAQRRADALVELARRTLDSAELPTTAGERPHLQIRVDLATLLAGTGTAGADWAGPLSAGAALRLACDATTSPVLTAGPSEVLDLGRSVRLVSPAQRRALVVRDGGCLWPGCDRPPAFTDAHHLRHWVDGGATDLDNLALVCRRHHRLVHVGWELAHRPDGIWSATPPGAVPASRTDRDAALSRGP